MRKTICRPGIRATLAPLLLCLTTNIANADAFTKLDHYGNPLPQDAIVWACAEHQATGIMLEVKNPAHALHNPGDWFVNWHPGQSPQLGGRRANPESGTTEFFNQSCFGYQAGAPGSYCNTADFIDRVNQSNYCGYSDWRLPNAAELSALNIADSASFPHLGHHTIPYWSSSDDGMGNALAVAPNGRVYSNIERDAKLPVRLIRSNK